MSLTPEMTRLMLKMAEDQIVKKLNDLLEFELPMRRRDVLRRFQKNQYALITKIVGQRIASGSLIESGLGVKGDPLVLSLSK